MTTTTAPQRRVRKEAGSPREEAVSETDFVSIVKAYTDVTERLKRSHDALAGEVCRLREELHEKNKQLLRRERLAALGEMAAGVAHEIRNPLGGIGLYASLLERDLADRPKQQDIVRKMSAGIANLDAIVGDILAFAVDAEPNRRPVSLKKVLDSVLAQTAPKADALGIGVQIDPALATLELYCDAGQIERALINLVLNALEATADGRARGQNGCVRIRLDGDASGSSQRCDAGRKPLSPDGAGGSLGSPSYECAGGADLCRIVVEDSGSGVPAEIAHRVFDPFFTTRAAGTGLGLAIVHRIADANLGSISVANGNRGGAAFVLSVPLSAKRRQKPEGFAMRTTTPHGVCVGTGENG